jgi:hypothetical protein
MLKHPPFFAATRRTIRWYLRRQEVDSNGRRALRQLTHGGGADTRPRRRLRRRNHMANRRQARTVAFQAPALYLAYPHSPATLYPNPTRFQYWPPPSTLPRYPTSDIPRAGATHTAKDRPTGSRSSSNPHLLFGGTSYISRSFLHSSWQWRWRWR